MNHTIHQCRVAGISFANDEGESRQGVLARAGRNAPVRLVREPSNPHDPNAIRVDIADGSSLGYVPRTNAAEIAAAGHEPVGDGFIVEITGRQTETRGCVIRFRTKPRMEVA